MEIQPFEDNGLKYNYLKTETLPYKPLYFSPGSIRLEPDSKYSDLIGTISPFNCLYLDHYVSDKLKFVNSGYFRVVFQNVEPK